MRIEDHYNDNKGKSAWDKMLEDYGPMAVIIFDCLNARKYYERRGKKNGESYDKDTEKMVTYMQHALNTYLNIEDEELCESVEMLYALFVYRTTAKLILGGEYDE